MRRIYKFERRKIMNVLSKEVMKKVVGTIGALAVGAVAAKVIMTKSRHSEHEETEEFVENEIIEDVVEE